MEPNVRRKIMFLVNGYSYTSIATIYNDIFANDGVYVIRISHVEISLNERRFTLIEFDHDLSTKSTLIGY